jgi:hypothetical protein
MEREMSKSKIHEMSTRNEVADLLASLAQQLRSGTVSIVDNARIPVAEDVELKAALKRDEFELDLKWKRVKHTAEVEEAAQPVEEAAMPDEDEFLPTGAAHYPDV